MYILEFQVRINIERKRLEINRSLKYESCGTFPSPITTFRQNHNPTNGLNARARSIDQVHLRKITAISRGLGKVQFEHW